MRDAGPTPIPPYLALIVGVLAVSTASTLIRLAQVAQVDSLAIAAWRLSLASLMLAPFALATRREELGSLTRREWKLAFGAGLLLAVHFAAWIASLALTSVAASVVLVTTNPLFVGLGSYLFLKERLGLPMVAGMVIAMAGSLIIGLSDMEAGTNRLTGDLLALLGALAAAGYFMIGRQLRARLSLLGYVFPVYATSAVLLMAVAALSGAPLTGYPTTIWLWLFLLALGPQIVGHSALNWALRHLTATYVTLAILTEPIGSALLAWVILDEPPTLATVVGGGLILAGVVLASQSESWLRRRARAQSDRPPIPPID